MVTFARLRTRSWLTRLWNLKLLSFNSETIEFDMSNELIRKHKEEKKRFLEAIKNGGMWFS